MARPFSISRAISGGSVGIAFISTIITRQEQFHDFRIGEAVTAYSPTAQSRLQMIAAKFMVKGGSARPTAMKQAYASIEGTISKTACVMATNDAFMISRDLPDVRWNDRLDLQKAGGRRRRARALVRVSLVDHAMPGSHNVGLHRIVPLPAISSAITWAPLGDSTALSGRVRTGCRLPCQTSNSYRAGH